MKSITIWHNPRCSKSRAAFELLSESGLEFETYKYLIEEPSIQDIEVVLSKLNMDDPREMMRTKEDIYVELGLKDESDRAKLISAMVQNPKLIERPIVVTDDGATIGRPLENISNLLGID